MQLGHESTSPACGRLKRRICIMLRIASPAGMTGARFAANAMRTLRDWMNFPTQGALQPIGWELREGAGR